MPVPPESQAATAAQPLPSVMVKPRTTRLPRPIKVGVRSPDETQVAQKVTAILRGMRHAEQEQVAEVCEDGACQKRRLDLSK